MATNDKVFIIAVAFVIAMVIAYCFLSIEFEQAPINFPVY